MKHKRLKLSALLLFGIGLTGLQAQTMYVKQTNGMQTAYMLGNIEKMSFAMGNITVNKTDGNSDAYPLNDIRYLNFTDLTFIIPLAETPKSTIHIYPNPVIDVLNIQLSTKGNQSYVIEILSIDGRVFNKENINGQINMCQINVSLLPRGIYLCKTNNGITTETTKFIKL